MATKIDRERHIDCGFVIPKKFARDTDGVQFKIPEKFSNLLSVDANVDSNERRDDEVKLTDSEFWLFSWLKSSLNIFPNMSDAAAMSIVKAVNCDIPISNGFLEKRGSTFSFDSSRVDLSEMAKLAVSAAAFAQSKISVFGPPDFIQLVMKYSVDMQVEIDVVNFTTLAKNSTTNDYADNIPLSKVDSDLPQNEMPFPDGGNSVLDSLHTSPPLELDANNYEEVGGYEPIDYDQLLSQSMSDLDVNRSQLRDNFVLDNAGWNHDTADLPQQPTSDNSESVFDQLSAENQFQGTPTSLKP
ncbi:hypothetical protein [Aeromonas hydrophila]|uniref:hypothetical protein n=1 Tax=Aeromonas hydrophila TaxID=644 RepID=UPI002B47FDE6|nr:hypothetical protein [Aeromonas hydrophila]